MPGFNDFDVRVSRSIPIHDAIHMDFAADAFNVLNHQIVTGVNGTYTTFLAPGASATVNSTTKYTCQAITAPSGSSGQTGCFVPYQGTGLTAFGATSSTSSSNLYTARQLQVSAKLVF
jgi:hypothetical protein